MSVQPPQDIKTFLQQQEVQKRIQKSIHNARSKATVTISQAASLFDVSESRLREWEKKGLLTTNRPTTPQESKGHRQYAPNELDKLAIIKVLIDEGGYSPGLLSQNVDEIDEIWEQAVQTQQNHTPEHRGEYTELVRPSPDKHLPIDKRVQHAEKEVFWRYFTSQALRLSLMLICEDIPDTIAGIVLPLHGNFSATSMPNPHTLPEIGEALVGWLDLNRSFYTFLDTAPSFEAPTDFRIERLVTMNEVLETQDPQDETLIVVQRKARPLNLSVPAVETARRLLAPIYQRVDTWRPAFERGMRDWLYQATDFTSNTNAFDDVLLNDMMDMVIHLGGKTADDRDRWRFACLLLPDDPSLPLQQRKLIVRSQSQQSPYKIGTNISSVSPGLSLRAYQSGNVIYQPNMSEKDSIIAYREQEQNTHSAIAIPIAGEDGLSIATLYIASSEIDAFPEEDRWVLRIICQMVEELLLVYSVRQLAPGKLAEVIKTPDIVDTSFKNFLSENDFIRDLEALLIEAQSKNVDEYASSSDEYKPSKEEVSFIAIDIDNHSAIATKYGDRIARNLSREVGSRLFGHLTTIFANSLHRRLYHINADKYYLVLDGMPVDEAKQKAEQIRVALKGEYPIDAQRVSVGRPTSPEAMLKLPGVTVRLGIPAYTYRKLKEILGRYSPETAVPEVRTLITNALDEVLKLGQHKGGDVIISWDHKLWWYTKWTPPPT
jgi:DNA-binding transcriptional MerR regulator/GGDEF domain-containing protein